MKAGPLTIALLTLLLASCGDRGAPASGADEGSQLRGRTFLSTKVTENSSPRRLAEQTKVTFRFTEDGRLLADAGCNTMAGPVNLRGGRVEVSDLAITEMGCDPARHEQDSWLASFIDGRPSWRLDGGNLVVSAANTELVLTDKAVARPDLPLRGTTWAVDTIMEGQTASSVPAGAAATLVFEQDTVRVEAGCNQGSGSYHVSGNTIHVDAVATTRMACEPDRMTLENAVLGVLNGEVSYDVDADHLTLKHPSGKALRLTAR